MAYDGFVPDVPPEHAPFWEGLRSRQLLLQRCDHCGRYRFVPGELCPQCFSRSLTWTPVSGQGTVYTFTVVRRAPTPAYQARAPYVLAQIELEEGPRITSALDRVEPEEVRIGMPVRVLFEDVAPDLTLYRFTPA
ncbi:MAG: Zn-ribbon domain-containing OB-fold protein [Acidimicrobiaceae bacterium]|nr:Zn-ribbon domain-containing OB-fold protein [Acidimicrobiaceae bacterium]